MTNGKEKKQANAEEAAIAIKELLIRLMGPDARKLDIDFKNDGKIWVCQHWHLHNGKPNFAYAVAVVGTPPGSNSEKNLLGFTTVTDEDGLSEMPEFSFGGLFRTWRLRIRVWEVPEEGKPLDTGKDKAVYEGHRLLEKEDSYGPTLDTSRKGRPR